MEEEERRERRRRQRQQVVNCCKQLAAFLFSHVGLAAMVVAYSIMGGFLFRAIEAPQEKQVKLDVIRYKEARIQEILDVVRQACGGPDFGWAVQPNSRRVLIDVDGLNETLKRVFTKFQVEVKDAVKEMGWDGNDDMDESALQWSLAGAILYAVTVITTIGYGHIAPKTVQGRMLTILYALVGIPLTFLYLSNIGNFLADCFRLFYKRICCDIICCQKCERKRKRERLKLRRRRELAAQRNILLGMHSEMLFRLPQVIEEDADVDVGDDGDSRLQNDSIHRLKDPGVPRAVVGAHDGDDNPGFTWETHCDNRDNPFGPETFPRVSFPSSTSSTCSRRTDGDDVVDDYDENDDDEQVDEEDDETISETSLSSVDRDSVETVRETAILENDNNGDDSSVLETAIVEDYFSGSQSHRSVAPSRGDPRVNVNRARTPSFHAANGFHLFEIAKETDIVRGESSTEGDSKHFRDPAPHYRSDPSLPEFPSEQLDRSRCPASSGFRRVPARSLTLKPHRDAASKNRNVEYRHQAQSAPVRSEGYERSVSSERCRTKTAAGGAVKAPQSVANSAKSKSPAALENAQQRAKVNWKKLIEYTKQLAAKESQERTKRYGKEDSEKKRKTPDRKSDKSSDSRKKLQQTAVAKKSLLYRRNPPDDEFNSGQPTKRVVLGKRKCGCSTELRNIDSRIGASPNRITRSAFHRSEESFVTAASNSVSSEGETEAVSENGRLQNDHYPTGVLPKRRAHSLNSVVIDIASPGDDPELDFPDFIQDQPITFLDDPFDYEEEEEQEGKVTVPISICLIIISGYLFAGSALFAVWEQWDLWTGSYFCFITLSTIGFGDIVPGTDMKEWASEAKLVLCALWLAFGLSLLAMCFNLMQEEVKDKCKWIGQKLGLLKDEGQS